MEISLQMYLSLLIPNYIFIPIIPFYQPIFMIEV